MTVASKFLILGEDKGNGGKGRTDTIMLVNYTYKDDKVNIISIPRDTLININGKNEDKFGPCLWWCALDY